MIKIFLITPVLFLFIPGFAQPYSTGMSFDDEAYEKILVTAPLSRGDFDNLPHSIDLRPYAPTPGNQGQTGTCTAWSSAYHARTITESIALNRTNKSEINKNTFSPSYIYNQIRLAPGCQKGTYIHQALELMSKEGVAKFSDMPFNCDRKVYSSDKQKASSFKIDGFKTLFVNKSNNKILPVKKSLSEKKPVVIGMECATSFFYAKSLWTPKQEEYQKQFGGHAMVTVGYDDNRYGGAFLVMNSWGEQWGERGFVWIKYTDYNHFVKYAFEMIGRPTANKKLSGSMTIALKTGGNIPVRLAQNGYYISSQDYSSGTQFRLMISNHQPAYVYALGSDLTKKSFKIFPHKEGISPFLGYQGNNVIIPGEKYWIRMNETVGKDYFCVLYSSKKLDINNILRQLETAPGTTFKERLKSVLGTSLLPTAHINYSSNKLNFNAQATKHGIVPIILEIDHI